MTLQLYLLELLRQTISGAHAGTSADMYRTVFDLLVSVKLFLGRFDMRTMQVELAAMPCRMLAKRLGFTLETRFHISGKTAVWLL